jgi:hypothetical protein
VQSKKRYKTQDLPLKKQGTSYKVLFSHDIRCHSVACGRVGGRLCNSVEYVMSGVLVYSGVLVSEFVTQPRLDSFKRKQVLCIKTKHIYDTASASGSQVYKQWLACASGGSR